MKYTPPIYDRTAQDVIDKTSKAYFNVADWQRVYGNSQYVNALVVILTGVGITFNALTEPTITSIPTVIEFNTMLANIERLRLASGLSAIPGLVEIKDDWAEGSAAVSPDYVDVNAWEQVLDIIFTSMGLSVEYIIYCGVAAVGQPRFYQHRWRQYSKWIADSGSPVRRARSGVAITNAGLTRNNKFRRYA